MDEKEFLSHAIRRGFLTFEQAESAVQAQKAVRAVGPPVPIWEVLLVKGHLSREQVDSILKGDPRTFSFGHFQIYAKLGEGGMGVVYRAKKQGSPEFVALKVLPDRLSEGPAIQRFQREARVALTLSHPNLVKGLELGQVGRRWYYSMELVQGRVVGDLIKKGNSLDERTAIHIAIQISEPLGLIHRSGLVHRDVKPENIIIGDDGVAKLMDLGLVKSTVEEMTTLTQSGHSIGTPHYMSPEQMQGQEVDGRSDLYSLGATLFHMVTGQKPFAAKTTMDLLAKQLGEQIEDPQSLRPELSDGICHVIEKLMACRPADRYPNAESLIVDLRQVLEGGQPKTEKLQVGQSVIRRLPQVRRSTQRKPAARASGRNPWPAAAGIGGALAGLLVVLAIAAQTGSETDTPPVPPPRVPRDPGASLERTFRSRLEAGDWNGASRAIEGESATLGTERHQRLGNELLAAVELAWAPVLAACRKDFDQSRYVDARKTIEQFRERVSELPEVVRRIDGELARISEAEERALEEGQAKLQFRALDESAQMLEANGEYDRALGLLQGARVTAQNNALLLKLIDQRIATLKAEIARRTPPPAGPGPSVEELLTRARAEVDAGRFDAAMAILTDLLQKKPELTEGRILRANCFLGLGNLRNARLDAEEALKLQPASFPALLVVARVLAEEKKWAEAAAHYTRCIAADPSRAEAYVGRSKTFLARGDHDPALRDLREACRLHEGLARDPEIARAEVEALYGLGKHAEGVQRCAQWLQHRPTDVAAFLLRAAGHMKIGQPREAELDYVSALAITPGHAEAQKGLEAAQKFASTSPPPPPPPPPREKPSPAQIKKKIEQALRATEKQVTVHSSGKVSVSLEYAFSTPEELLDFELENGSAAKGHAALDGSELVPAQLLHRLPLVGDGTIRAEAIFAHESPGAGGAWLGAVSRRRLKGPGRGAAARLIRNGGWEFSLGEAAEALPGAGKRVPFAPRALTSLILKKKGDTFTALLGPNTQEAEFRVHRYRAMFSARDSVLLRRLEIQGTVDPDWVSRLAEGAADEVHNSLLSGPDMSGWIVAGIESRAESGASALEAADSGYALWPERFPSGRFEAAFSVQECGSGDSSIGFVLHHRGSDMVQPGNHLIIWQQGFLVIQEAEKEGWKIVRSVPVGKKLAPGEVRFELSIERGNATARVPGVGEIQAEGLLGPMESFSVGLWMQKAKARLDRAGQIEALEPPRVRPPTALFNGRDLELWQIVEGEAKVHEGAIDVDASRIAGLVHGGVHRRSARFEMTLRIESEPEEGSRIGFCVTGPEGSPMADGSFVALFQNRTLGMAQRANKGWKHIGQGRAEGGWSKGSEITLELILDSGSATLLGGKGELKGAGVLSRDAAFRIGIYLEKVRARVVRFVKK
jgi:serine/threonine-protein kinase